MAVLLFVLVSMESPAAAVPSGLDDMPEDGPDYDIAGALVSSEDQATFRWSTNDRAFFISADTDNLQVR